MLRFNPQYNSKGNVVTTFMKFDQSWYQPKVDSKITCPTCNLTEIKQMPKKWIGKCEACDHIHNFLVPHPFQLMIQQTSNKIINVFGGVGSAKSVLSASVVAENIRTQSGIKIYAMAQTIDQLEQTSKSELEQFFLSDEWDKHNQGLWLHKNGSEVNWIGSDSEQKLRGRNAGFIWLMEASSIPHEIHVQATQRIRQSALKNKILDENGNDTYIWDEVENRYEIAFDRDKSQLLLETNPHLGWVRTEALLKSHTIIASKGVRGTEALKRFAQPKVDPESGRPIDMVSFMFASPDNPMMSSDFLADIRANSNSKAEYERDIYCNMSFTEGLVFGEEMVDHNLIDEGEVNFHGKVVDGKNTFFVEAIDPGGSNDNNDATGYILAMYENVPDGMPKITPMASFKRSGLTLDQTAKLINERRAMVGWTRAKSKYFVCDPSGKRTNHYTHSYAGDLAKLGIHVSTDVNNDINYGIRRMKTFIAKGRLTIYANAVPELAEEIRNYRWSDNVSKSRTIKKVLTLPVDRDNHMIDPLRYLIVRATLSGIHRYEEQKEDTTDYSPSLNVYGATATSHTKIRNKNNIFTKY